MRLFYFLFINLILFIITPLHFAIPLFGVNYIFHAYCMALASIINGLLFISFQFPSLSLPLYNLLGGGIFVSSSDRKVVRVPGLVSRFIREN